MLGDHPLQHGRIRRRAGNGGDAEFADGADQQLRVADAERHDGGARRFERRVIGIAAHPQAVIEAMDDAMARPEPARRMGARADHRRLLGIFGDSARFIAVPVVPEVRWTRATLASGAAR